LLRSSCVLSACGSREWRATHFFLFVLFFCCLPFCTDVYSTLFFIFLFCPPFSSIRHGYRFVERCFRFPLRCCPSLVFTLFLSKKLQRHRRPNKKEKGTSIATFLRVCGDWKAFSYLTLPLSPSGLRASMLHICRTAGWRVFSSRFPCGRREGLLVGCTQCERCTFVLAFPPSLLLLSPQ
jgi:hypothetical protein